MNNILLSHFNSNVVKSLVVDSLSLCNSEYVVPLDAVIVRFPVPVVLKLTVQFPNNVG